MNIRTIRKHFLSSFVGLTILTLLAGTSLQAVAIASADATYQATPGAFFNDPTGTVDQQNAIVSRLIDQINNTGAGATIRMAFFSLSVPDFLNALIAAYQRGVHVMLIMDDHAIGAQWQSLQSVLGTKSTAGSYAILCHTSCMNPATGDYMHAKFYQFSSTGSSKLVLTVSSANPTTVQEHSGWNNAYTVVGNSTMYSAYKKYFNDMVHDATTHKKQPSYYWTSVDGNVKSYFMPHGGTGNGNDFMYGILSNVSCSGAAKGYGTAGHTVIQVAMYEWTAARVNLAQKLWSLDNAGCAVEVVYTGGEVDPSVLSALTKKGGKYGGVTIHNGAKDVTDTDGTVNHMFVHDKYMLINGKYDGDTSSRFVFTGSQNWSNNALHYNNEVTVKLSDAAAYNAFAQNFISLRTWAQSDHTSTMPVQGIDKDD